MAISSVSMSQSDCYVIGTVQLGVFMSSTCLLIFTVVHSVHYNLDCETYGPIESRIFEYIFIFLEGNQAGKRKHWCLVSRVQCKYRVSH